MPVPDALLVAIGGNATHPENIRGTTEEQETVAERAARALLPLAGLTDRLLITHVASRCTPVRRISFSSAWMSM